MSASSGLDKSGEWRPAFPGQREPFREGHSLAVKHGAYATLSLGPRATEIAETLRAVVPGGDPVDSVAVEAAAMVMARLERAMAALDAVDDAMERPMSQYIGDRLETLDQLGRLRQDARGWANVALRYLDALALVPTSRGRLGLDVVKTEDAIRSLAATGAEIRARRRDGDG